MSTTGPAGLVLVAMEYDPIMDTRSSFEKKLLKSVRSKTSEVAGTLESTRDLEARGRKSTLDVHVRWLYLAICPDAKIGRPLTNEEIRERGDLSEETTVSKAVNRLAKMLSLELMRTPGPRPSS